MDEMRSHVRSCVMTVCLLALTGAARAQDVVMVTGRVVSNDARAAIPDAVVVAREARTTSDPNGAFALPAAPGALRLTVSATGFIDEAIDVVVAPGLAALEIALARRPPVREEVTVSAESRTSTTAPAAITVAPSAVLRVAGAGDNIFRALQTLPGISGTDDFGSRLAVRGGGPDQNLTVMDGVEIHNPYRLFGLTSAFNPETVERFELTAGGFGAEYGDRLSSILLVENRSGTSAERFSGSAALSFTDANVVFEGKLPGTLTGSWLVTGRRTYYDLVADRITGTDLPSFGDVQAKSAWEVKPGHQLTLFALRSRERTAATFTDAGDRVFVGDVSENDVISLNYRGVLTPRAVTRTTLAWYDYGDDLGIDASVRDGARRSNAPGDEGEQRAAIVFTRALGVRDVSVREQVDWQAGRGHLVAAGFDVHALRTTWGWTITGDRNNSVANGSAVIGGTGLPSLLNSTRDSTRASMWVVDRMHVGRASSVRARGACRSQWSQPRGDRVAAALGGRGSGAGDAAEGRGRALHAEPRVRKAIAVGLLCRSHADDGPHAFQRAIDTHDRRGRTRARHLDHGEVRGVFQDVRPRHRRAPRDRRRDGSSCRQVRFPGGTRHEYPRGAPDHECAREWREWACVWVRRLRREAPAHVERSSLRLGLVHLGPGEP